MTYEELRKCDPFSKEKIIRGGLFHNDPYVELAGNNLKTGIITLPNDIKESITSLMKR